jgi:hypothetical protein
VDRARVRRLLGGLDLGLASAGCITLQKIRSSSEIANFYLEASLLKIYQNFTSLLHPNDMIVTIGLRFQETDFHGVA